MPSVRLTLSVCLCRSAKTSSWLVKIDGSLGLVGAGKVHRCTVGGHHVLSGAVCRAADRFGDFLWIL